MSQVKLVIWDLDDTFWKGTLSESEIVPIEYNINLVKTLTKRGIINSISSKNDYEKAKIKLEELGIWDYFVFPIINWNPKGENVNEIITLCQLRASNVLFIDDNISNLKEVEHYNPDIQILPVEQLPTLLSDDRVKGKDDSTMSRLNQYKILEKKAEFRTSCSDNSDFLYKSNIRIQYLYDIDSNKTRIAELIARSNQLNYTKIRIGEEELVGLTANPNLELAAIRVVDNFGDYGICGFYALDKKQHKLLHYLFSCRILNLGVESYIYQQLGCPNIEIAEPISTQLDSKSKIDWIHLLSDIEEKKGETKKNKIKVLLMGGCDLDQVVHYFPSDTYEVLTDFNYPSPYDVPVHRESLCCLKLYGSMSDKERELITQLPFNDTDMFDYNFFKQDFDVFVYSVLVNYTQVLYRNKKYGFVVSYGGYEDITKKESERGFTNETLSKFKDEYECIGQLSAEDFYRDLSLLLNLTDRPIIFINGAEVDFQRAPEELAPKRHKELNAVLERFIEEHADRCALVDVRKYVRTKRDCTDCIRHYKRLVYVDLAMDTQRAINNHIVNTHTSRRQWHAYKKQVLNEEIKHLLHRICKKIKSML